MNKLFLVGLVLTFLSACTETAPSATADVAAVTARVLVFSKTAGYRHAEIPTGIATFKAIGEKQGYEVDATEDASAFNEENLSGYHAVVFLNTTLDVLNKAQQNDFERFIQAGGGFVGIHAAADTEYDWPWYNKLVGAYFESHPNDSNIRTADFHAENKSHGSMDSIPEKFSWTDEFYSFKSIQWDLINVLLKIDESTYEGGTNGDNHPMSWFHDYDGGRAFYTAMGHTKESYAEPIFIAHVTGGLEYAIGGEKAATLDYSKAKTPRVPDENRFEKVVLSTDLNEPVELAVMNDGRVLFIERQGKIKLYEPVTGETKTIYDLSVSHTYLHKDEGRDEAEDGLLGLALDPNFDDNGWVYLYYSLIGDKPVNVLTRWDFKDNQLIESSMKTVLEVVVQREQCCHTGGSIDFDAEGNLYLSTGDNTSPRGTTYAPIDERPGRFPWDAQKGSGNTNDLRGKVIRITPQADGTYTIPKGNLFPVGTKDTRPEIYGMGMRNPYRISVDQKTGYVYWGDVGPDARDPEVGKGPTGFDEINQMRKAGNFGWPYFVGNNQAYYEYDFATETGGELFDVNKPINNSPNNTGLQELPPANPAFIWYSYVESEKFPEMGAGGRTAMAGPVYYRDMFSGAKRAFPDYYNNKLFIYEWIRGWIIAVTMDEAGNYAAMERFMPNTKFSSPMDMAFGPSGDLYMLEYGTGWFRKNDDARLIRIEYTDGNRKPQIVINANATKGALPFVVEFSSEGTLDFDRDELSYEWKIANKAGTTLATFNEKNPSYTFNKAGEYFALLTVNDGVGGVSTQTIELIAGNAPPVVSLGIANGNGTYFFPGKPIHYKTTVTDLEDGTIPDNEVSVTLDFLQEGFDKVEAVVGHLAADEFVRFAAGKNLMADSDCAACHQIDQPSIGPMYMDVAKKYKDDSTASNYLTQKIINGGNGTWGEAVMPPHTGMSVVDAGKIVSYVLSLADEETSIVMPLDGQYTVKSEDMLPGRGTVILRASYEDKGANGMPAVKKEQVLMLQAPVINVSDSTLEEDINTFNLDTPPMTLKIGQKNGSILGFDAIELTNVGALSIPCFTNSQYVEGGFIEVRIDSPDGKLIGKTPFVEAKEQAQGSIPTPTVVIAEIEATEGTHSLYFVFRNGSENLEKNILVITNVSLLAK